LGVAENKDIIVVGTSAGGVPALETLVAGLPGELEAAMFVVLHLSPSSPSHLAAILQRRTKIPIAQASDGEPIRRGRIYLARPDYHLVLEADRIRLPRGPRENRHRPAIDALFRSAAYGYGGRVIGVLLTGELDDGTAGLWTVKNRGGTVVVQDPAEAQSSAMPRNALEYVEPDYLVGIRDIAPVIAKLTREAANSTRADIDDDKEVALETRIALEGRALEAGVMGLGPTTPYTCPECHGVLVQLKTGGVPRFRCHTGHAYSANNLLADVTEYVEGSLWNAIRTIEESAMLLTHLAGVARNTGRDIEHADLFEKKAIDTQRRANLVRQATMEHQTLSKDNIAEVEPESR
jgi:two-component system, chemotaxis family, protein-glutamate methylesterase/glutaminase